MPWRGREKRVTLAEREKAEGEEGDNNRRRERSSRSCLGIRRVCRACDEVRRVGQDLRVSSLG